MGWTVYYDYSGIDFELIALLTVHKSVRVYNIHSVRVFVMKFSGEHCIPFVRYLLRLIDIHCYMLRNVRCIRYVARTCDKAVFLFLFRYTPMYNIIDCSKQQ